MPYKPMCGHRWIPHGGKLRCEWCGALGYQRKAAPGARKIHERIYVYLCEVPGCRNPAVVVEAVGRRCKAHRRT